MKYYTYTSPTGDEIIGTLEILQGIANILAISEDGSDIEYAGDTDVDWDSQETKTVDGGKTVFVDESGEYWTFDKLIRGDEVE